MPRRILKNWSCIFFLCPECPPARSALHLVFLFPEWSILLEGAVLHIMTMSDPDRAYDSADSRQWSAADFRPAHSMRLCRK